MLAPAKPADESHRLAALHSLGLLDTSPDERFDRITRIARYVADVPIALVSLVDQDRQWFKSLQGLSVCETAREISFCAHAILQEDPLIVPDSHRDNRFADNPLVTGAPYVRFYAGHAIHAPNGARIGTLCVIDTQPRDLSVEQLQSLADLAAMVDADLLRLQLGMATRAARIGVYERSTNFEDVWWSAEMWEIFGQDSGQFRPSWSRWLELIHDDDRERVLENAGNAKRARTSPSIQYRIVRPDGTIRHVQSIGSSTKRQQGEGNGSISGVLLDVTTRVETEERDWALQQQLRENSHQAGMAEIATGILHNVGNVLNSLGIASDTASRGLKFLKLDRLEQASKLICDNRLALASFLTEDSRGKHLPDYLSTLSDQMSFNVAAVQGELQMIQEYVGHLRHIVGTQQALAKIGGLREPVSVQDLLESALLLKAPALASIHVERVYEVVPLVTTDRHKVLQILLNFIDNAGEAVQESPVQPPVVIVRVCSGQDHVEISVEDTGVGMSKEVLSRLWNFGYTTKNQGHGFGLHNSANAAREIGATVAAHSDGRGKGSRFTLRLPLCVTDARAVSHLKTVFQEKSAATYNLT